MTKFEKDRFSCHAGYLTYRDAFSGKSRFVARFKYKPGSAGTFRTFLIKNFTTEEYFGRLEKLEAPLTIVESKGYILPHIRKWLKDPRTAETARNYIARVEARRVA